MKRIIIIGGGPAGMAACYALRNSAAKVILFEKNEKLGKKLFITGKGRCNVTNAASRDSFFENIVRNPKFFYHSFSAFTNDDLMLLLKENGCPLKIERGGRVFPVSDHSSDICKAWERIVQKSGAEVHLHAEVKKILFTSKPAEGSYKNASHASSIKPSDASMNTSETVVSGVIAEENGECFTVSADAVLFATGGLTYPLTGSDGFGHHFLKQNGIEVTPCYPALVECLTRESWVSDVEGLSLRNVRVFASFGKRKTFSKMGEFVFTKNGVSGPLFLSLSAYLSDELNEGKEIPVTVDLKPALSEQELDARLLREFREFPNKDIKTVMKNLLPESLILPFFSCLSFLPEKKVHDLTKEERFQILFSLKNLKLTLIGTKGFPEAVITMGGVSVSEIHPNTLELKKIKNLYIAGELLDLHALTGGYNLQIAWSTGYAAGLAIERSFYEYCD